MSDLSYIEMLSRLKGYKMSPAEKRAQAVSWAVGQVLLANPGFTEEDEWQARVHAAKWYDAFETLKLAGVSVDLDRLEKLRKGLS